MCNSLQYSRQSVHARGDESTHAAIRHYPADTLFYLEACQTVGGHSVRLPVSPYRDLPYSAAECAAIAARLGVAVRQCRLLGI